ncbi:hypothetical protein M8J77_011758 [Diaphorina citri]|nr:hypothetical protein M8J77_011758 [Diaphorina citri]
MQMRLHLSCPPKDKVLVPRGSKNVYSLINNDEKDCLTVLLNANGAGMIAPPLIIFPYERIPQDVVFSIPKSCSVGKSTSGWMTAEVFFEYISNVFTPWLKKEDVHFPILFFVEEVNDLLTLVEENIYLIEGKTRDSPLSIEQKKLEKPLHKDLTRCQLNKRNLKSLYTKI